MKMKNILLIFFLSFVSIVNAQQKDTALSFKTFEKLASYPGGHLQTEIANNFKFPSSFDFSKKGIIVIEFSVSKEGLVEDIKIISSDLPELNNAAIKAVKKLKKFKPAIQNGLPVKCTLRVPLQIS